MNWTLLHRYLSNEASAQEKKRVESWIESDRRNREFMNSMIEIWKVEPGVEAEVDARAAWNSFKKRLTDERQITKENKGTTIYRLDKFRKDPYASRKHSNGQRRIIAVSVTAAAVLFIAVLFFSFSSRFVSGYANASGDSPRAQEIITERGQRTNLRLYDGTRVQLNAESSIRIPPGFGDSTRTVHLQGQAYFDVSRNPDLPFIVHTGSSLTRVLGTKFDVKAYPDDTQVQVVVEEGRVSLSASDISQGDGASDEQQITNGQIGLLKEDGHTTISETGELQKYLGWKDGRLIFNSTTLEDAIPQLQRWYAIRIVVAESEALTKNLTASFKDEPMTEVMNIISLSLGLHYEREGRTITFYAN